MIAAQSTGSFSTEGGAVPKTAYMAMAEGAYTFQTTDASGYGICCRDGPGRFKATVNGEPVAISSSGEFRYVIRESFDVVRRSTGLTID